MRILSHILSLTTLIASGAASAAPTVCVAPGGKVEQAQSADKKVLVYVQATPSRLDETSTTSVPHEAICMIRNGGEPKLVLEGRPMPAKGAVTDTLAGMSQFVLSKDSNTLYFTSDAWVTSGAAHVLDLRTGKEHFLIDGTVIEAPMAGPFKGHLIVASSRLDDKYPVDSDKYRGRIDVWTVVDHNGRTVRRLPEDEKERNALIHGR